MIIISFEKELFLILFIIAQSVKMLSLLPEKIIF